jgi:hypothetical protein
MESNTNKYSSLKDLIRAIGLISGFVMLYSLFIPWEKSDSFIRIWDGLGFTTYGYDSLTNLDFLPFTLTLIFILGIILSGKIKLLKILAIIASAYSVLIPIYDAMHIILPNTNLKTGTGLWLFMFSSFIGFLSGTALLIINNYANKKISVE